jgi:hypothetical protein
VFGKKKEKNKTDNTESIKLDITELRADAGKRLDSLKSQTQKTGIVNLNEGAGIGLEYFTKNKGKEGKNKQSDSNK